MRCVPPIHLGRHERGRLDIFLGQLCSLLPDEVYSLHPFRPSSPRRRWSHSPPGHCRADGTRTSRLDGESRSGARHGGCARRNQETGDVLVSPSRMVQGQAKDALRLGYNHGGCRMQHPPSSDSRYPPSFFGGRRSPHRYRRTCPHTMVISSMSLATWPVTSRPHARLTFWTLRQTSLKFESGSQSPSLVRQCEGLPANM